MLGSLLAACGNLKISKRKIFLLFLIRIVSELLTRHIKANSIPTRFVNRFIGPKQYLTQNILVVCDFDLCFTFALPGWEGSAHDTRVFLGYIRN